MVRDFNDLSKTTMSIVLKTGQSFTGHDFPSQPFGEYGRVVCLWDNDELVVIPLSEVSCVTFSNQNSSK